MPSDDITRLYTFTAGTTIVAAQANGELDQLVTTMNSKVGRATTETITGTKTFSANNSHMGNNTFSGQNSFSDATAPLKTDRVDAYTAAHGVKIHSTSSDPASVAAGELWYNSTSNVYKFRDGSTTRTIAATSDVPTAATQSDQETATSTTTFVAPGRQHFHPGHPKSWVFLTTSGGTPTVTTSYGVTSVTDNGVGNFTINMSVTFSSANYCVVTGLNRANAATVGMVNVYSLAATNYRLSITDSAGAVIDPTSVQAVCMGDF